MTRRLTPTSAFTWMRLGARSVVLQPFALVGTVFAYLYILYLIGSLPWLGWLLYGLLLPFLVLSAARGSQLAAERSIIGLDIFAEGWKDRRVLVRLALLGVLIAVLQFVITALVHVISRKSPQLGLAATSILTAIATMFWVFAPMLIAWKRKSVKDALTQSFSTCLNNLVPIVIFIGSIIATLVVYGMVMLLVAYILRFADSASTLPLYALPCSVFFAAIWPMWDDLFNERLALEGPHDEEEEDDEEEEEEEPEGDEPAPKEGGEPKAAPDDKADKA